MQALFAARQDFLQKGYAILPHALHEGLASRIRAAVLASTLERSQHFANWPSIYSLPLAPAVHSDSQMNSVLSQLEKRRVLLRCYRQMRRRRRQQAKVVRRFLNGRATTDLTEEELWELGELVSQAALNFKGKFCTSTIANDPQMLRAINAHGANAWMTNSELREIVESDDAGFKQPLAQIAEIVGGVERPVVFGDSPVLRLSYGNAIAYQCTAPLIGVRTNPSSGLSVAATLILFTHTPSSMVLSPHILENSHRPVQEQYIRSVEPNLLVSRYRPMESHMPSQLKHFHLDESVRAVPLLSSTSASPSIGPGTVMIVNPHLMVGFGPNFSQHDEVVYRLHVIRQDAKPYMRAPSWIRGWRMTPHEINFNSPVVFPTLFA